MYWPYWYSLELSEVQVITECVNHSALPTVACIWYVQHPHLTGSDWTERVCVRKGRILVALTSGMLVIVLTGVAISRTSMLQQLKDCDKSLVHILRFYSWTDFVAVFVTGAQPKSSPFRRHAHTHTERTCAHCNMLFEPIFPIVLRTSFLFRRKFGNLPTKTNISCLRRLRQAFLVFDGPSNPCIGTQCFSSDRWLNLLLS